MNELKDCGWKYCGMVYGIKDDEYDLQGNPKNELLRTF